MSKPKKKQHNQSKKRVFEIIPEGFWGNFLQEAIKSQKTITISSEYMRLYRNWDKLWKRHGAGLTADKALHRLQDHAKRYGIYE